MSHIEETLAAILNISDINDAGQSAPQCWCPICAAVERSVKRNLQAIFAEFVNDPEIRLRFRDARGFCRNHSQLLQHPGEALAISILLADLADTTEERWRKRSESTGQKPLLSRFTATKSEAAPCPLCVCEEESERRFIAALAKGLAQPKVWEFLARKEVALCTRHVEFTAERAKPNDARRLLKHQAERIACLKAELQEYIRKNDYRFRHEDWGEERDAWLRALPQLIRPK